MAKKKVASEEATVVADTAVAEEEVKIETPVEESKTEELYVPEAVEEKAVAEEVIKEAAFEEVVQEAAKIETPAETSFVEAPSEAYKDKFADTAVVGATTAEVAAEVAAPKVKKLVKIGKGESKYGKTLVFVSYFALMLGAVIITLDTILDLFGGGLGPVLTGISQLMTYTVVAIIGLQFLNKKPQGWMIAYIVALVLIAACLLFPIIKFIVDSMPEKEETANQIARIFVK